MQLHSTLPFGLALGNWQRVVSAFLLSVAVMWVGTAALRGPVSLVLPITTAVVLAALILLTWRGAPLSILL